MSVSAGGRFLVRNLRPHRGALMRLMMWSAVEAAPTFVSGVVIAHAIDQGFLTGHTSAGFAWLAVLGVLWIVSALGTRNLYPWLAATIEPLRDSLLDAVVTASLRRALGGARTSASSVSQATEQVEAVRALLSTLLRNMRQVGSAGVAALGGLAVLSGLLAGVAAAFVTLAVIMFCILLRVLIDRYRHVVLAGEQVSVAADPVVTGVRDVTVLSAEKRATADVGRSIEAQAAALRAFARVQVLRLPIITVGVHLPLIALLGLSPWLVARHQLTVGDIAGGVIYLSTGLQPAIQFLVNTGSTLLVSLGVVLGRLAEVCRQTGQPEFDDPGPAPAGYRLQLDRVTFAYSPHAAPIVEDLTLDLPEGGHLAVVGPSGVGKSTLANLIARLAQPQCGRLQLGGVPLEELDETTLRREVALIPQEAYVFAGTVRENLTYLRPEAGTAALEHAVRAVGLDATLARLGGYDGCIPAGDSTLSPGERQLIALARVYLCPARVIVLDEATCHLDPVAEARAEQAFADREGTLIVIAHRISSALRAEQVLVMDGTTAHVGTHQELLHRSPLYAELVGHWNPDGTESDCPRGSRAGVIWTSRVNKTSLDRCEVPARSGTDHSLDEEKT